MARVPKPSERKPLAHALAVFVVLGATLLHPGAASGQVADEYAVKAAFLYNFAKFVEWPAEAFDSPDEPIVLAVAGESPFDGLLDRTVSGQTAQGRPFVVKYFRRTSDLERCHILFISGAEDPARWLETLQQMRIAATLTVGEGGEFCQRGAIAFLIEQRRIRLAINLEWVSAAKLRLSSRLLTLARVVDGRGAARGSAP